MPRKVGMRGAENPSSLHQIQAAGEVCSVCNLEHATEECPLLNSGLKVDDTAVPSKAVLTLPDSLEVRQEDGKWHVVAKENISKGVQFGPVDAPKSAKYNNKCSYPLKVFSTSTSSKQPFHFLDTSDEDRCNWMVLVPFSNDPDIRNCICYQLKDQIYFTVLEDLCPGDPLIVGYSPGYFAKLSVEAPVAVKIDTSTDIIAQNDLEHIFKCEADGDRDYAKEMEQDQSEVVPVVPSTRRSSRKRKAIDDDVYVFESIVGKSNASKKSVVQVPSTVVVVEEGIFFGDSAEDDSRGFITDDPEYDGDHDDTESSKRDSRSRSRERGPNRAMRLGPVLALEEWKCKFCGKVESGIPEFASHLIEHYRSVGTAKTEKLRLQRDGSSESKKRTGLGESEDSAEECPLEELSGSESTNNVAEGQPTPKYPYYCDICANKKVFNRAEYVIRHLRHHAGEITCTSCNQGFTKEAYLEHDCPNEDLMGQMFGCSDCENCYTTEKKLLLHLEWAHSKAFQCNTCQKSFRKDETHKCKGIKLVDQFSSLNEALAEGGSSQKCDFCDATFTKAKDLEKHWKTHGGSFTCTVCSKELSGRFYKTHSDICEAVSAFASGKASTLRCPKCSEDFDTRDGFRYHVATHTHPAMCPICNLRLPSTTFIRAHNCTRFQCDGCQEEFITLISLKKHISTIHGQIEFYCFECALPFVTQNGYASHQGCSVNNNFIPRKKTMRKSKEEGLFVCEVCGATYTKWSSLKTHRYTHGPKRFVCGICGKSFHRREMLADHEYVHQEAQFECDICHKKMKSKKSLDVHMQIHKGNKRFKCDQCDKAFCQKINLTTHKMVHLPPEEKGFVCDFQNCKKKFASKEYLGFHMEGHVRGRNEVCDICGRGFIKLHMLNQHKKTAHGNHAYACEFCPVTVRQKHSLTRHLKKRHKDMEHQWNLKGYLESRFVAGDGEYNHIADERRKSKGDEMEEVVVAYASSEGDDMADNTITFNKVDLLTEVVDVDDACEVETEEIAFTNENVLIPDSSNMMILQVKDGGEIVLTLASADSLPMAGHAVMGEVIVDENTLQLQCEAP